MSATGTQRTSKTKQSTSSTQGPREGSVVWAVIQVLDGKRKPMKPAEILAEIQKRGLAKKLSGKTPEASVAARVAVHVGIYFERPEKGKYQLKKGVTARTVSSTAGSKTARRSTSKNNGTKTSRGRGAKSASSTARSTSAEASVAQPQEPATAAYSRGTDSPASAIVGRQALPVRAALSSSVALLGSRPSTPNIPVAS